MRSYGSLLELLDSVELAIDPFVPDVPRHLLFLTHSVELALGNLITRPKCGEKETIKFYFRN